MSWDHLNARFDRAFERIGVREQMYLVREGMPNLPFLARFDRPQEYVLEGLAHSTDYSIEYTTSDIPRLTVGSVLLIQGTQYRVNNEPKTQGDGYWTIATLEAIS